MGKKNIGLLILMGIGTMLLSAPLVYGKKFSPKIGICMSMGNDSVLHSLGFDYIEEGVKRFLIPQHPEESFKGKLNESLQNHLPIYACNSFLPGELKAVGPRTNHDKILEYSETAFKRARESGVKIIVFGSSGSRRIPDGFSREVDERQFVALLKKMGPVAKKYKVVVVLEPLQKKECNFINRVIEGLRIVKAVDHPNIQLLADFFHMLREGETAASITDAGSYLKHVHLAENKDRALPGTNGEDFRPYLQALKEIGYKGAVSFECSFNRKGDYAEDLKAAKAYLDKQISDIL